MRTQKRTDAMWMSSRVPLLALALLIFAAVASSHAASNAADSAADSRITVTNIAGDVAVTMAGSAATVSANSTMLLPARIVTGHDGTLGLTQAGTNISVSSNTDVEIPAEAADGMLVARLVQHSGNVFYDVAPRDLGKLRVETPFLVAVIKGTQFSVAVQEDGTTISLFEGQLEIRTPDGADVVELNAGEIAIRSLIDDTIRIIGMDDLRIAVLPPLPAPAARNGGEGASTAAATGGAAVPDAAAAVGVDDVAVDVDPKDDRLVAVGPPVIATDTGIETTVDFPIEAEHPGLGVGRDTEHPGLGRGRGTVDGGGSVEGPVDLALDADLVIDASSIEVDLEVGADIGGVNVGEEAGLDLGDALDVGLDTNLDLGTVADTGADLNVDGSSIDLAIDAGGLDLDLKVDPPGLVDLKPHQGRREDAPGQRSRGELGGVLVALP